MLPDKPWRRPPSCWTGSPRGLTLATARQTDLDAWLSSEHATYRADAGNFIR